MVLDGVCMSFSSGCLRTCTLKKCSEITWDNFIKNIPFFFQFKYFGLRNSHQYGQRVGSDLQAIMKALKAKPPNRKPYQSLIQEFVESKVGGHVSMQ